MNGRNEHDAALWVGTGFDSADEAYPPVQVMMWLELAFLQELNVLNIGDTFEIRNVRVMTAMNTFAGQTTRQVKVNRGLGQPVFLNQVPASEDEEDAGCGGLENAASAPLTEARVGTP
jgi:hypothetical protein